MINSGQRPPNNGAQRPLTGTAPRPAAGAVQRPATGMTQRPAAGTGIQRPLTGTAQRPAAPAGAAQRTTFGTGAQRPAAGVGVQRSAAGAPAAAGQKPLLSFLANAAPVQKLTVGIADMKILQWDGELITYALGSCIGICLYDPNIKLAALIHIMLPINMEAGRKNTMKYADTGIRETIAQLTAKGARKDRLVAKIAGGAKMFEVAGNSNLGNIGARNIESVKMNLRREGIRIISENVGGSVARTLSFYPATGLGEIRAYGQPLITL